MISLSKVSLAYGGPPLLNEVSLEIRNGEKVCLVGRNGTGKSSLLKIISGEVPADAGDINRPSENAVAVLPQTVPEARDGTNEELLMQAMDDLVLEDWEREARLDKTLRSMQLDADKAFNDLSAGMKRRVLLGTCVIREPELLLLDEPTNHLDIESIRWLESFLQDYNGAILFVTHDRVFLQKLATRILDLDRGQLTSWDCDYATYLERKDVWLEAEAKQRAVFDKKLSQEETWIRQGIKARRTRNEGRVRALQKMRLEHRERRQRSGQVSLNIEQSARSGAKVIEAKALYFGYGETPLVKDFDCEILRGDKVGIVGPNGAGKTTLIRLLLGKIEPSAGSVKLGTKLQVAYFDQLREQINDHVSVFDNIADGNEMVEVNGKPRHVMSYLKDFLFTPDRARGPVMNLSGGERNRLLLARLFTRPFNLLVMDEPTNDLDMETLDLLEELLQDYAGTLLLVSHDRAFLNNVVTELLVIEGEGKVRSIVGGYDDYLAFQQRTAATSASAKSPQTDGKGGKKRAKARKFLNRERWELEALPAEIDALETETQNLAAALADTANFQKDPDFGSKTKARMEAIEEEVAGKLARWEELEQLREELEGG
ncbi:MAG: ATP-binding cassette domain-containing protein [Opitutales bacterium]|nr:ATP-binding cassette domain-containing protein [Opitutales bacterium]